MMKNFYVHNLQINKKHSSSEILLILLATRRNSNQRTSGPVNAHLIAGPTVSTKTSKIGQGQPRVIIYIHFLELEFSMLHDKFQDHRTSGSGEDF